MAKKCKRRKMEQGQALVEFALICAIMLLLAGGVFDGVRIIRYNIMMNGAVTEVINQLNTQNMSAGEINTLCQRILKNSYQDTLGDGKTKITSYREPWQDDARYSYYHDYTFNSEAGSACWTGYRKYARTQITMERKVEIFSAFGRLVFGDNAGDDQRTITTTASARIYTN